jgi:hypothetical protein
VELASSQLDQKSIENILIKIYELIQDNPSLVASDVVKEIAEQLRGVLGHSGSNK